LIDACLSVVALPTMFYVVRKQADRERAFQVVDECLKAFEMVPVNRNTAIRAQAVGGKDFEDDLQIACAVESHAVSIVTRDVAGFTHSPIPAITPAQLLQQLAASP
jgi:predicted nucleic acid-binding protein